MADFTDVANVLRDTVSAAIYPQGVGGASAAGFAVRVYQGWPVPAALDADLKTNIANVSVWPTPMESAMPDHFPEWQTLSVVPATLTATVASNAVTIGGTVSTPQTVAVVADGLAFAYAVQAGDTLATIAAAVAAGLVATAVPATSVGAVVTLTNAKHIAARVGGQGTSFRELGLVSRVFQVSCWAWAPDKRETLAKLVDVALRRSWRVLLPDGTYGNLIYKSSSQHDEQQKQLVYRRDLLYSVEFATIETRTDAQVLIETLNTSAATVIAATVPIRTVNF